MISVNWSTVLIALGSASLIASYDWGWALAFAAGWVMADIARNFE